MERATRGSRTRSEILAAGVRLFSLRGYSNTSTSDILEAVSLSKGAFYYHFKSKDALASAVLREAEHDCRRMLAEAALVVEAGTRVTVTLARLVELQGSGQWAHCLLLARMVQDCGPPEGELAEQVAVVVEWLTEFWAGLIVDDQTAGTIDKRVDSRTGAEMIVSAVLGAVSCSELDDRLVNLEKVVEHIRMLLTGDWSAG